ncbi:hypothetical protein QOZ80_9BG0715310 [Eleusine coracana subsp. coracana]|nr:hypothetical protein QOZ80_9BG0715310 [Eleusine coracana subsp. coracana]
MAVLDRLSLLSDAVLGHILSFLPATDAARAAVLSRRWRHVFVAVHTLSFDDRDRRDDDDDDRIFPAWPFERPPLADLVTAALLARHPAPLRELRVAFRSLRGLTHDAVDQWLGDGGLHLLRLDLRVLGDELSEEDLYAAAADDDKEEVPRATMIPVPRRLFTCCAALRSLRLGPCSLDLMPPAIHLPSLDTLLLTRAAGAVQRLVDACPRLADLTLEDCVEVTSLRLHDNNNKRLRALALRGCHGLTTVTMDELRVFEYRGGVPGPDFFAAAPVTITSCTLDLCHDEEQQHSSSEHHHHNLRGFLQLFAGGVTRLHLKSARLGLGSHSSPHPVFFPECTRLRHLELTGIASDKDATILPSVSRILERTPSLETLSLFFLPDPDPALEEETAPSNVHDDNEKAAVYDHEDVLSLHWLKYDRRLAVPEGGDEVRCLRERVREINLVHYQGGRSQRALPNLLLRHALVLDRLCCAVARGPLWMQCGLAEEIRRWAANKSTKMMFV